MASRRSIMGIRNERVLPVPVEAVARMSFELERGRNRLGLHGRGDQEAGVREPVLERVGDVEVCEADALDEGKIGGGGDFGCCGAALLNRGLRLKRCGGQVCSFICG